MKSKLIVFVVCFTLFQVAEAQTFGVKGGINLANMSFSTNGMDLSPKSIIGIHVGPVAEFELQESLYFNTGILYSLKGYKLKMEFLGESMEATAKFNCLEIPLNFAYKHTLNDEFKLFGQVGPYLGYALSGKAKSEGETEDVEFGEGEMKRIDFGIGIGAGIDFGLIATSLNYQLGLANIVDDPDVKVKNKVFQISVAYMFGK
jgi:hypothetical protein